MLYLEFELTIAELKGFIDPVTVPGLKLSNCFMASLKKGIDAIKKRVRDRLVGSNRKTAERRCCRRRRRWQVCFCDEILTHERSEK